MGVKKEDTWKMVKYFVNMKCESYDSEDDLNPGFVEENENWVGMVWLVIKVTFFKIMKILMVSIVIMLL